MGVMIPQDVVSSPCQVEGFLESHGEFLSRAVCRAWFDEAFRARLLSNPRAALEELELTLPEGLNFRVIEESGEDTITLALPRKPSSCFALSDEELEQCASKTTVLTISKLK